MSLEVIATAEKAEAEALRRKTEASREAAARIAAAEEAGRDAIRQARERAAAELQCLRQEYDKAADEDEKQFLEQTQGERLALREKAMGKLEQAARYIVEGIVSGQ